MTPGPWEHLFNMDGKGWIEIRSDDDGVIVAYVQHRADAKAIEALPDLIKACQHALSTLRAIPDSPMTASEALLDFAITKATK